MKNTSTARADERWSAGVRDIAAAAASRWDHLLMEQDDPEKRIAELERQLAEQKRMAERQLADAKAGEVGIPPAGPAAHTGVTAATAGITIRTGNELERHLGLR